MVPNRYFVKVHCVWSMIEVPHIGTLAGFLPVVFCYRLRPILDSENVILSEVDGNFLAIVIVLYLLYCIVFTGYRKIETVINRW